MGGANPKQLVLLTATPVNNTLFDLHALVSLFVRNDAAFVDRGIASVYGYIKRAQDMDAETLSHEHLFALLDEVAVRRTRRFVKRHYAGDTIPGPDGREETIKFPTPVLSRLDYTLDRAGQELLNAVVYALDHSDDAARYDKRVSDPDQANARSIHSCRLQEGKERATCLPGVERRPSALYVAEAFGVIPRSPRCDFGEPDSLTQDVPSRLGGRVRSQGSEAAGMGHGRHGTARGASGSPR